MPKPSFPPVVQIFRRTKIAAEACTIPDKELLDRFIARKDESAFSILLNRHSRMVFGVCRRILRNLHDAEDAFQGTFLVLAKRAASISDKERLGNWLYGVAIRVSLRAKARAEKRQQKEHIACDRPSVSDDRKHLYCEVQIVIDEELQQLPEKYRHPLVLSLMQGLTKIEIAQNLGWPEGTVSARLDRGKKRLRKRLSH